MAGYSNIKSSARPLGIPARLLQSASSGYGLGKPVKPAPVSLSLREAIHTQPSGAHTAIESPTPAGLSPKSAAISDFSRGQLDIGGLVQTLKALQTPQTAVGAGGTTGGSQGASGANIGAISAPGGPAVPVLVGPGVAPGAARKAISVAEKYLNTPYHWGGASPKTGFDCSGLLQYSWGQAGVRIPRTSQQQWHAGRAVGRGQLRAGDAVFFEGGPGGPGHVGMMIDRTHFIESPHTGAVVRISKLAGRGDFVGARRYR